MKKPEKWTLVQHSAAGYGGNPQFVQAVEERPVLTEAMAKKVLKAGGVLFDNYLAASNAAEAECYPEGYHGLIPRAPGTFSNQKIDGLVIYIPAP